MNDIFLSLSYFWVVSILIGGGNTKTLTVTIKFIFHFLPSKVVGVVMRKEWEVYSVSCIGVLPFIDGSLGDGTSGLVAVSRDSEEHA